MRNVIAVGVSAALAALAMLLGIGHAHADPAPAPPPAPGQLSPGAADQYNKAWQQWNDTPCGVSFGPMPGLGFSWIRVKPCPAPQAGQS
jgi:hypothetical protein